MREEIKKERKAEERERKRERPPDRTREREKKKREREASCQNERINLRPCLVAHYAHAQSRPALTTTMYFEAIFTLTSMILILMHCFKM